MNYLNITEIPYPLAIVDNQMVYKAANESYTREFGLDKDIIGKSHYSLFKTKSRGFWPRHKRALQGETVGPEEDFVELESGLVWFRVRYSPIFNNNHQVEALLIACENITERKLLEERLKDYSQTIARNHEILETLFWILSHDLKLPINNLAYFARDLKRKLKKELPAVAQKILMLIEENADNLLGKFQGILKYASLDLHSPLECFSVPEVLNEVLVSLPEEFRKRLILKCPEDVQLCERKLLFVTVFENIFGNIYHHALHKNLQVLVEVKLANDCVHFDIEDNGPGLPRWLQEQLWKPFKKSSTSKTSSGVGLSLVKKAVDNLGGSIKLSTAESFASGTNVSIKLPLKIL